MTGHDNISPSQRLSRLSPRTTRQNESILERRRRRADPYVPGEQPKIARLTKLNTNESPYPPSPRVLAAIRDELGEDGTSLRLYPDPNAEQLKQTLARLVPGRRRAGVRRQRIGRSARPCLHGPAQSMSGRSSSRTSPTASIPSIAASTVCATRTFRWASTSRSGPRTTCATTAASSSPIPTRRRAACWGSTRSSASSPAIRTQWW